MKRAQALVLISSAVLAACASAPPEQRAPQPAGGGIVLQPAHYSAFEETHHQKALTMQKERRWAEAALEWEILTLLRPENTHYQAQLREVKARIAQRVEEHLRDAEQARQRGDVQAASASYLKALSLQPSNALAVEGVRSIDLESRRRNLPVRVARTSKEAEPTTRNDAVPERSDAEFPVMLLRQGDYAGSVKALEKHLKSAPKDDTARRYLADAHFQLAQQSIGQNKHEEALYHLQNADGTHEQDPAALKASVDSVRKAIAEDYYQKGMKVYRSNLELAIAQWERSLQYDPVHPQAAARLQRARQMQENLKAIDSSKQ